MPLTVAQLPALNAILNATATVLLLVGYVLIKRRREQAHTVAMVLAFAVSVLFLVSYVTYHFHVRHVEFVGPPGVRRVYLLILLTHVVLAATVPFLAGLTIYWGFRDRRVKHRRLARWTFPIWLYVSVTGVIIYLMLYQIYTPRAVTRIMPPCSLAVAREP